MRDWKVVEVGQAREHEEGEGRRMMRFERREAGVLRWESSLKLDHRGWGGPTTTQPITDAEPAIQMPLSSPLLSSLPSPFSISSTSWFLIFDFMLYFYFTFLTRKLLVYITLPFNKWIGSPNDNWVASDRTTLPRHDRASSDLSILIHIFDFGFYLSFKIFFFFFLMYI